VFVLFWGPVLFLVVAAWRWAAEMLRVARSISRALGAIAEAVEREEERKQRGIRDANTDAPPR
jgi:hypothetical protein